MLRFLITLAVMASFTPLHAQAQAQTPDSGASADCELHVWPGSDLVHLYYGWAHGGTINGAAKGREGYPQAPENPLTVAVQAALLERADLPAKLARPGYKLVVHPAPLSSREIRTSKQRLGQSQSPCYAELMIDDLLLSQNVISGSALRTSFRFRDFGPDASPERSFGNFVITELRAFPPKTPDAMPAGIDELKLAFTSNLAKFANALVKASMRDK